MNRTVEKLIRFDQECSPKDFLVFGREGVGLYLQVKKEGLLAILHQLSLSKQEILLNIIEDY